MIKKFQRRWVNSMYLLLKTIGINVRGHQKTIRWYEFYQFGAIFPIVNGFVHISLYAFVNRRIVKEAIIGVGYLAGVLVVFASIYIFWQNKDKLFNMLRSIDDNIYGYPNEDSIRTEIGSILREESFFKVVLVVFAYESLGFSLAIVSPLITFLFTGVFEARIIPSWYPQHGEGVFGLMIDSFLQMMGSLATFWVYNVSQILITTLTIEFCRQYERLKVAIRSIRSRTEHMVMKELAIHSMRKLSRAEHEWQFRKKYDNLYRENFTHCVRHHQKLCKLFYNFQPWFDKIYSVELAISVASFALAFYNVLFVRDPWNFLSVAGCALVLLTNLFSKCIVGEVFAKLNEEIKDATFYDTNWWEESVQNRKLLLIFHGTTMRAFNLKGFSLYPASYYTFTKIVRITYNFLNLVRSTLR